MSKDIYLDMCIHQSYVPKTCTLKGEIVWGAVNAGQDPCAGCKEDRIICKGRKNYDEEFFGHSEF